jgi:ankyrin repeat protein
VVILGFHPVLIGGWGWTQGRQLGAGLANSYANARVHVVAWRRMAADLERSTTVNSGTLQGAVRRGDAIAVRAALVAGVESNGNTSVPLLHLAARRGHAEVLQLLIEAGADVERESRDGWTALTRADAEGQAECVEILLRAGADPTTRTRHGFARLHRAARLGRAADCECFLADGDDVNARAADGSTAVMFASQLCDPRVAEATLRVLLRHGGDPNIPDHEDWYPLSSAAYEDAAHADFGSEPIVRVPALIEAGADPNRPPYTPLVASISQEGHSWEVIDLLLTAGADPARPEHEDGWTILHRAASQLTEPQFAVKCAAVVGDVDRSDSHGDTAADIAVASWQPDDDEDMQPQRDFLLALAVAGATRMKNRAQEIVDAIVRLAADPDSPESQRRKELVGVFEATRARYPR